MGIFKIKKFLIGAAAIAGSLMLSSCGGDDTLLDYSEEIDNSTSNVSGLVPVGKPLHVDGKYLKGPEGQIVNLHGFCQTYSPYFNRNEWSGTDVASCLRTNKAKIDKIMANGWGMDFVRLHMDPHWTCNGGGAENTSHTRYDQTKFKKYLDEVFVPMAEYMQSKGMRVVMRPPGVCPETIAYKDSYYYYLMNVWKIVANHPDLKNNPNIMFELANEPVNFKASDGKVGASGGSINKELSQFFQDIVNMMRNEGCNNILWIPGTSWQQNYEAYKQYPIKGNNIGYAIHCYPGWYGSDAFQKTGEIAPDMWHGSEGGYTGFKKLFTNSIVNTVGQKAPIIVTEMDWSHKRHDSKNDKGDRVGRTWGSSITGVAGGKGFGENFRKIMDECGNVSFVTFAWDYDLAAFDPKHAKDENNFLYDPESCVLPIYRWYKEYWEAAKASAE